MVREDKDDVGASPCCRMASDCSCSVRKTDVDASSKAEEENPCVEDLVTEDERDQVFVVEGRLFEATDDDGGGDDDDDDDNDDDNDDAACSDGNGKGAWLKDPKLANEISSSMMEKVPRAITETKTKFLPRRMEEDRPILVGSL